MIGVAVTLFLAAVGGTLAGEAISGGTPPPLRLKVEEMYEDGMFWEEVEEEKPEEDLATGPRV